MNLTSFTKTEMNILHFKFLIILCFLDFSSSTKSGFDDFIKNQEAMKLVQSYKEKQIRTINELHDQLKKKEIKISICSLKIYLGKISNVISKTSNKISELSIPNLKFEKCVSRDLSRTIYIVGNENMWRKYRTMNENNEDIYIGCVKCLGLQKKEKNSKPIVAYAVLRGGNELIITRAEHNSGCKPETLEKVKAEQADRVQRKEIYKCNTDIKTIWRQGLEKLREKDAAENEDSLAENSFTTNYPSWITVRRAYNRRRQQAHGSESADPFDVSPRLQLTKFGAIKLIMGKTIEGTEWMRYKNREIGVMLFASKTQLEAVKNCKILVADATFELEPKGFRQIWLIHGLVYNEKFP